MNKCNERKVRMEDESEHHTRMKLIAAKNKKRVDLSDDNDVMSSVRGSIMKSTKSPSKMYRGTRNLKNESA